MGSLFKKKKAKPTGLTTQVFEQLCRDGERSDQLIGHGKLDEGQQLLGTIFRRMMEARSFDEFLLAKVCLSQIQGSIAASNVTMAHAIWTQSLPGPPGQIYGVGIQAIESGVLEVRDTLIYQATGSFLHACNTDIEAARKAVDHVMSSVLEGASEHIPEQKNALAGHWKYCLTRVYDDDPAPSDLYDQLESTSKKFGVTVPESGKLAIICPSPWRTDSQVVGTVGGT